MNIRNWQPPALLRHAYNHLPDFKPALYAALVLAFAAWCYFTANEMTRHLIPSPTIVVKLYIAAMSAVYFGFLGYGIYKILSFVVLNECNRPDWNLITLLGFFGVCNVVVAYFVSLAIAKVFQHAPPELFGWMMAPSISLIAILVFAITAIEMIVTILAGMSQIWRK